MKYVERGETLLLVDEFKVNNLVIKQKTILLPRSYTGFIDEVISKRKVEDTT